MQQQRNSLFLLSERQWFWVIALLCAFFPGAALASACTALFNDPGAIADINECDLPTSVTLNVIGDTMCIVRYAFGSVMFEMYCALVDAMRGPFYALLTLYLTLYFIALTFGMQGPGGGDPRKDVIVRMAKVLVIATVALNAEIFSLYVYRFFTVGLIDGFSSFLFEMGGSAADFDVGGTESERRLGIFNNIDKIWEIVVGTDTLVGLGLLGILFILLGITSIVGFMLLLTLFSMIMAFFRLLISFAVAMVGLGFLLVFTPVFVPMILFRATNRLFVAWFAQVVTFTIQPILALFFLFIMGEALMVAEHVVNTQSIMPITPDGVYRANMGAIMPEVKVTAPRFDALTGNPGEDGDGFFEMVGTTIYFTLAFFIITMVMSAFLEKIPEISQVVGAYAGQVSRLPNAAAQAIEDGVDIAGGAEIKQAAGGYFDKKQSGEKKPPKKEPRPQPVPPPK